MKKLVVKEIASLNLEQWLTKKQIFSLSRIFLIFLMLIGCQTKLEKISDLIEQKKFAEAEAVVNNLSSEEKKSPEVLTAIERLRFCSTRSNLPNLNNSLGFIKSDSIFSILTQSFRKQSIYLDSLITLRKINAFTGADELSKRGKIKEAYSLIIKYNHSTLNHSESTLLNNLMWKWLGGKWIGYVRRIVSYDHVSLVIKPLSAKFFSGTLQTKQYSPAIPLQSGIFDGEEFSASYSIHYFDNFRNINYVGTLVGVFDHGNLKIDVPVMWGGQV